ncbi:proteasome subunit beta type-5-like isoform X2 [Scaptodrosophila lebanonensis]|nr:proteasome subunit beta type-5-like isoform X2 [Scaptodrosophila lebanonensis]
MEFKHGTTTLGFIYQGGIILCVDSRSTSGDFIGSQHMKKIIELNDYMLITMAGGAADCTYWDRVLAKECRMYELRYGKRITVISAANMLANTIHQYRDMGLSMGMMLAGFDGDIPKLIYLDSEGYLVDHTEFAVGSGSTLALGLLDTFFKWDMTDREAYDLACRSICNAAHRDAYSGGIVRLYHVTADGWKNINNTDCCDLFEHFEKRKAESRASIAAASESQSETGSELPISIIS